MCTLDVHYKEQSSNDNNQIITLVNWISEIEKCWEDESY